MILSWDRRRNAEIGRRGLCLWSLLGLSVGPFREEGARTESNPDRAWKRTSHVADTGPTQPIVVLRAILEGGTNVRRRRHGKSIAPARRESPSDAIENE